MYTCRIIGVRTYGTEPEEKYFENPTYDDSSMIMLHGTPGPGAYKVPVLPVAVARRPLTQKASEGATRMYDAVNTTSPKDARKGQTYDVLDRGKVNGKSKLNVHAASYRMTKIGYAFCFT